MSFEIQSRAAIMRSAFNAAKAGKTVNDWPLSMEPYQHLWKYEFTEAQRKLGLTSTETTLQGE
ncbi:MAG: hypothetical protein A3I66_01275 [Burkholderiales bacterium RIFCSPLOWO2_02_FULL_57_36]|nr:MAG: hypothetical protein A3I66_01275 [Burkholderiales bacterium RIFCSPLOWO2_02_FULL_57_36]